MKFIVIQFSIVGLILLFSCTDDTTSPPPLTEFSVKISVKNPSGTPVAGLRISAWNHLPSSVFPENQKTRDIPASPLSASTIQFSIPMRARINLEVFEFDGSHASTLVDQILDAGMHTVNWYNQVHRPTRVYYYRLIAKDTATTSPLFRDSLFAVLWHVDSEIAILGWSSLAGTFETSDKLLFPNVLDLPTLIHTGEQGPDSLNTFVIPDMVTIGLTDTVTHQHMKFDRVIKKGIANNIELVWNPTLSKQWVPYHLPRGEQQATIRTNRLAMVLFDWKLYQNYPNPFN